MNMHIRCCLANEFYCLNFCRSYNCPVYKNSWKILSHRHSVNRYHKVGRGLILYLP